MAVFLGAKGGDILSTMRVSSLLVGLKEKMAGKLAYLHAGEDEDLYRGLRGRIEEELAFEKDFFARLEIAKRELDQVEYPDQLPDHYASIPQLAKEHFLRRKSVVSFNNIATAGHDLLLRKSLSLAGADERATVPCCLMSSGGAGRRELTLTSESSYFAVCPDTAGEDYCERLKYRLIAILRLCGVISPDNSNAAGSSLWLGREHKWREWAQEQAAPKRNLGEALAALGDLRCIVGAEAVCGSLTTFAGETFLRRRGTDIFGQTARKLSALPVALGIFGSFKTSRIGEHRGEFDIDDAALTPLVANVRILAIHHGLAETCTVDRIKVLVNSGHLGVDLAERLLKAYHVFSSHRIQKEIDGGDSVMSHHYLDPEQLSDEEQHRVKGALEAVVNLQRIVYQVFGDQG